MSQSHSSYSNHEQPEVILNDMLQNDLMNRGIIIHDSGAQPEDESNCKTSPNRPAILTWLGNVCNGLISSLSSSPELQIRQKRDRNGNILWLIYDPMTRHLTQLHSEEAARIWVERSYSHH